MNRLVAMCGLALVCGCFSETTPAEESQSGQGSDSTATMTGEATTGGPATGGTDRTTTGSTSTDPTTSAPTETGTNCDGGDVCVDSLPPEWLGPVYVAARPDGTPAPPCPAGNEPQQTDAVHVGLLADGGSCGCSCDAAGSVQCEFELEFFDSFSCGGAVLGMQTVQGNVCEATAVLGFVAIETTDVSTIECPGTVAPDLPAPTWSEEITVCSPSPGAGACEVGDCIAPPPPGFGARICVRRVGEHECVGLGPYVDSRVVAYEGFDDQRSCPAECDCETDQPASCPAELNGNDDADCEGDGITTQTDDCFTRPEGAPYVRLEVEQEDVLGSCEVARDGLPVSGDVEAVGPVTYCCQDVG